MDVRRKLLEEGFVWDMVVKPQHVRKLDVQINLNKEEYVWDMEQFQKDVVLRLVQKWSLIEEFVYLTVLNFQDALWSVV